MRAKSISTLIGLCANVFYTEQEAILNGDFNRSLMDAIEERFLSVMKKIESISVKRIYNYSSVVQIESCGLPGNGWSAGRIHSCLSQNNSKYHKKLVELIPGQFLTTSTKIPISKIQSCAGFCIRDD